jgi:glycosyltransferase involved in cell wall biosynthesis
VTALRILMVAPQPFLRPRGTPFSVLHRIRSLLHLGHTVDLVTYPFGEDVELDGLRIFRTPRPPGVRDVPIGPSLPKLLLDGPLFLSALRRAARGGYDLLHTHEEAGWLGPLLRRRTGVPHLYDMHSSLPQQLHNFGRFDWGPVVGAFDGLERQTLESADGVIAICQALADRAREAGYRGPLSVIENTLDLPPDPHGEEKLPELRERLGLEGHPVVVYTGSLERYQGLDLLLDAAHLLQQEEPSARVLVVGGSVEGSRALAEEARARGVGETVRAIPAVPPGEVPLYHRLADVLVTTRTRGTNTPLKLYQYLRSGRPMVATAIHSHTQVLDEDTAELVAPDAESVARGLLGLIRNPERRARVAARAAEVAEERYGEERYHALLRDLLERTLAGGAEASRQGHSGAPEGQRLRERA